MNSECLVHDRSGPTTTTAKMTTVNHTSLVQRAAAAPCGQLWIWGRRPWVAALALASLMKGIFVEK